MKGRALILNQSRSDLRVASAGGGPSLVAPPAAKSVKSLKATLVGQQVLAGLDKGRQRAIEAAQARSRERASLILTMAAADIVAGKPKRGRSGRIARKLARSGEHLSESQVRRLLRRLSSALDSIGHTHPIHSQEVR